MQILVNELNNSIYEIGNTHVQYRYKIVDMSKSVSKMHLNE